MSVRTVVVVLLAVVFAGSAAVGVNSVVNRGIASPKVPTVPVVVAALDVPRFTSLSPEMLKVTDFPADMVPPGTIRHMDDAVGRVASNTLVRGEALLDAKLAPKGAGRGMAAVIPPGMRGFAILTPNVATGVAGFILPGDRVDVLVTMNSSTNNQKETGGALARTLLENIEILAVHTRVEAPSDNRINPNELQTVTLLVSPQQENILGLAMNRGTLQLSLRNPKDTETAAPPRATLAELEAHPTTEGSDAPPAVAIRVQRGAAQEETIKLTPAEKRSEKPAAADGKVSNK